MGKGLFINDENLNKDADLGLLSDEMTFRRYFTGAMNTKKIFSRMSTGNYITIEIIEKLIEKGYGKDAQEDGNDRIYLKDLAAHFKIPMYKVSEIVRDMSERGMVTWTHDGKGEEGTYIVLTESGMKAAKEQQAILKEFYSHVIERFGKDKFVELLGLMADLDQVMESELDQMEEKENAGA